MENTDLIERLVKVEQSDKSAHNRIDKVESEMSEIKELTLAVKEIAMETKAMREDLNNVDGRLKTVEAKPMKTWDSVKVAVISSIVSLIVGTIGGAIIGQIIK